MKRWSLLRKLGATQPSKKVGSVAAGNIANILFKTSNIKPHKKKEKEVKREFQEELRIWEEKLALIAKFTAEEVYTTLKSVNNGNAAGVDRIFAEFLKNLDPWSFS